MRPLWLTAVLGVATVLWSVAIFSHAVLLGWLAWLAFERPETLATPAFLATAAAVATMPAAIGLGLAAAWKLSRRGRRFSAILAILAPILWPALLAAAYAAFGIGTTVEFHWPPRKAPPTEARYDGSRASTPVRQPIAPAALASSSAGTAVTLMPRSS
jgi:hypothetical protein